MNRGGLICAAFSCVCAAILCAIVQPAEAQGTLVPDQDWFSYQGYDSLLEEDDPLDRAKETLRKQTLDATEERFQGQDPRYLDLLRVFAGVVTYLAECSVTVETGWQTVRHLSAESYRIALEKEESYNSDGIYAFHTNPSGDPAYPYRVDMGVAFTWSRIIASPTAFRLDKTFHTQEGVGQDVMQRAWGGTQFWTIWPSDEEKSYTVLGPASEKYDDLFLLQAWEDVQILWHALSRLRDMGPPTRIEEAVDGATPIIRMHWTPNPTVRVQIDTDPRRHYVPIRWTVTTLTNQFEKRTGYINACLAQVEPEFLVEARENYSRYIAPENWEQHPFLQTIYDITFTNWRKRANGTWVPGKIERAESEVRVDSTGTPLEGVEQDVDYPGASQLIDQREWITFRRARGKVSPQEAFASPPGYELYTGYRWIDIVLPADETERRERAEEIRAGLMLQRGPDIGGVERWMIADVDLAELGAWPFQVGDLILGSDHETVWMPRLVSPGAGDQANQFLDDLVSSIENTSNDIGTVIRVARKDQLVDVVCWVPESESPEDLVALQEEMLRYHVYSPLPYVDAVAFAEAVLAATDNLVRGTD